MKKGSIKKTLAHISNGEFEFFIDKESRTVVALFRPFRSLIAQLFGTIAALDIPSVDIIDGAIIPEQYLVKSEYRGKAVASPEDEFDEVFGMELAKYRALREYLNDQKRIWALLRKNVCKFAADVEMEAARDERSLERVREHLDRMNPNKQKE